MPILYTTIGPFSLHTYTLLVGLGIAFSIGVGALALRERPGALVDCALLALAGGLIGGRVVHVLLQWSYFAYHTDEIIQLRAGGLDWHGALLGGLVGLAIGARWRHVAFARLRDALAPALPLIALGAWWGCWLTGCAYGAEVDTLANHPAWAVSEAPDIYGIPAPRYNTQLFGMVSAIGLLGLAGLMTWRGWLRGRRFGLLLALLSLFAFVIGFWRADFVPIIAGLRADQWLDLLTLALGLFLLIRGEHDDA